MFAPSQKAQDEASGCDGYEARLGLMDRLRFLRWIEAVVSLLADPNVWLVRGVVLSDYVALASVGLETPRQVTKHRIHVRERRHG
jgi:hypothetical protein